MKTLRKFGVRARAILLLAVPVVLSGCAGTAGDADPVERGLLYIANALVASAVIRALFNK